MGALASVPSILELGSCFPPRVGSDGSVAGGTGSLLLWFGGEGGGSLRLGCGPSVWAQAIPSVKAMVSASMPMPANILNMVPPRRHSVWNTQRRTHPMVQFKKPIGATANSVAEFMLGPHRSRACELISALNLRTCGSLQLRTERQ